MLRLSRHTSILKVLTISHGVAKSSLPYLALDCIQCESGDKLKVQLAHTVRT